MRGSIHLTKEFIELSYYEAITNEDVLEKKSIEKYVAQYEKNNRLQKNDRDTLEKKYRVFYKDVEWLGRGKERVLKLKEKYDIPQIRIHGNTDDFTVYGAALFVLYLHEYVLTNMQFKSPIKGKANWLKLTKYYDNNFGFRYREDVPKILNLVMEKYLGNGNPDIFGFAWRYYNNTIGAFVRDEFEKIKQFLESNYGLKMNRVERYNIDEESLMNLYADALCIEIEERQNESKEISIYNNMLMEWINHYKRKNKKIPGNLKELILDYPLEQIKSNISKCISIQDTGLGIDERVTFDIKGILQHEDYEKINSIPNHSLVNTEFYNKISRITPTIEELRHLEEVLYLFCETTDFDVRELNYNKNSDLAQKYSYLESVTLKKMGYLNRYFLMQFDEEDIKSFYRNKPFLITYTVEKEPITVSMKYFTHTIIEQYDKSVIGIYAGVISEKTNIEMDERLKSSLRKNAYKNRAWINIKKQKLLHPSFNHLLHLLMCLINEFLKNTDNLPTYVIENEEAIVNKANNAKILKDSHLLKQLDYAINQELIEQSINALEENGNNLTDEQNSELSYYKNQINEGERIRTILNNITSQIN